MITFIRNMIQAYQFIKTANKRAEHDKSIRESRTDLHIKAYEAYTNIYPKTSYMPEEQIHEDGWIQGYLHLASSEEFANHVIQKDQQARMGALLDVTVITNQEAEYLRSTIKILDKEKSDLAMENMDLKDQCETMSNVLKDISLNASLYRGDYLISKRKREGASAGERIVPEGYDIQKSTMAAHNPEMYMETYGRKND